MFGTGITFAYDWDYWALRHKVTFDATNKLILVNHGVTTLNWQIDVYSAWKEWMRLESHFENPAVLPALRTVGGDNITSDGQRKLGATFFLTNGWRLKPWSGDHRLSIIGNVFTDEGDSILVPVDGDFKIVIEQTVSSLTEVITPAASGGTGQPSAQDIASAVWDQAALANIGTGTFGAYINMIKAGNDNIVSGVNDIKISIATVTDLINTLTKFETNRTRVDQTERRLYVYDNDGVTVLKVFDLKDFAGLPSVTQIAERSPVP